MSGRYRRVMNVHIGIWARTHRLVAQEEVAESHSWNEYGAIEKHDVPWGLPPLLFHHVMIEIWNLIERSSVLRVVHCSGVQGSQFIL